MNNDTKSKIIKDGHILIHPLRFKILKLLETSPGLHISEIARSLNENRALVSFHLLTLLENDFVIGEHRISEKPKSKGKAIRVFQITDKTKESFKKLKHIL